MKTRVRRHPLSLLAALLLPLVLLAACGGDDGDDSATDPAPAPTSASATESMPSESPSESAKPLGPVCDDVWVEGAKLPGGYQDCYQDDQRVKADGRYCEFGKPLVTYDNRFWAVPGAPVHEVPGKLLDDAGYRDALAMCSG